MHMIDHTIDEEMLFKLDHTIDIENIDTVNHPTEIAHFTDDANEQCDKQGYHDRVHVKRMGPGVDNRSRMNCIRRRTRLQYYVPADAIT